MKSDHLANPAPPDAAARWGIRPIICDPTYGLPASDLAENRTAREGWHLVSETLVSARLFLFQAGAINL